jgi:hypothetical protein
MKRDYRREADLIGMLESMNEDDARELAARMKRCRDNRISRRETPIGTYIDALRAGPQFKCHTVACWVCRTAHIRGKKEQAGRLFAASVNSDCSLVTINSAMPCADLGDVADVHRRFSVELRNFRGGLAKRDRRFARMSVFAILEVAHDGSQWRPHWHVLVAHPRVDRQEIADVFRKRFPGPRRVQVEPFKPENTVKENVENCVGYVLKFQHSDWSVYQSAQLFFWTRKRSGLRSMCVLMNSKVQTISASSILSSTNKYSLSSDLGLRSVFSKKDGNTLERSPISNWLYKGRSRFDEELQMNRGHSTSQGLRQTGSGTRSTEQSSTTGRFPQDARLGHACRGPPGL